MASLMRCVERVVVAHAEHLGDVVEIEQRQRAAGDLLGAAIGVAVERIEQLGHVEPGDRADRRASDRALCGTRSAKRDVSSVTDLPGVERDQLAGGLRRARGADAEVELLDLRGAVRLGERQLEVLVADRGAGEARD